MQSKAATVTDYLAELEPERAAVIRKLRTLAKKYLPKGFQETMNWGMICYEVPLKEFPDTYNKQPLVALAIAAQKNNYALYLSHGDQVKKDYAAAGKKCDMGQSCLRLKSLDNLLEPAVAKALQATTKQYLIEQHEKRRK
jgi:hypothetical protein